MQRREKLLRDSKVTFHLDCDVGRDVSLAELRARHDAVLIATGVYKARDIAAPGVGLPGIAPALDYLTASNRSGLGDTVRRLRLGRARCQGQARRGDRRRRHGDGLRAHRRAPGRQVGEVPLSPRPRQHAGLAARGEARRGRRRRVRLALRAAGVPRQATGEPRALGAHPSRHARFDRPPDAAGDPQQPRQHRGRPGAEGAGLRSRGPAGDARARPISASPAGARSRSTGRA